VISRNEVEKKANRRSGSVSLAAVNDTSVSSLLPSLK
jgi:hypothetical protein